MNTENTENTTLPTEYSFKTTINCQGCVAKAGPVLDKLEGVLSWEANTQHPDKILSIKADGATPEVVQEALGKIGFKAVLTEA
jgi:copper chaperone